MYHRPDMQSQNKSSYGDYVHQGHTDLAYENEDGSLNYLHSPVWDNPRKALNHHENAGQYMHSFKDPSGLRSVLELPSLFQGLFSFRYFSAVQSDCFGAVYGSNINVVVAAPTGSGKTVIMELAIIKLLSSHLSGRNATSLDVRSPSAGKALYLAPMRALVQEKAKDWKERYGQLGAKVVELTGDSEPDRASLDAADVICSTPEKFDSCTRRLNEGGSASFFGDISLVLIDEVHLLGEPGRGAALEAGVVSRIKMVSQWAAMSQSPISRVRFVAVSATIPNVEDIATWLQAPLPAGMFVYGEEMRPVQLKTFVKWYSPAKNDFLFERNLNTHLPAVIQEFSQGKPTLVFCSSRKGALEAATSLSKAAPGRLGPYVRDQAHASRLRAAATTATAKQLRTCLECGVGFHHAAMDGTDRELVERLFLEQQLSVLCTTSTLALGVNLPAHLVIIKGTRRYCASEGVSMPGDVASASGYKEYDRSVCLQMVGRAGRPQFDKEGVAVIMTQKQTYERYLNLMQGAEEVESSLKDCFPEHLNAEIVLQTIQDVPSAVQWLKSTFLYVRMLRDPFKYGVPQSALHYNTGAGGAAAAIEQHLKDTLVLHNVRLLAQHGLVDSPEASMTLRAAAPGRVMAHYYIALDTMIKLVSAPPGQGVPQLLGLIARAAELSHIHIRRGEKMVLQALHAKSHDQGGPRYPIPGTNGKRKDKINTTEEKIYVLLNEALSDAEPDKSIDYSMRQEQEQIVRVAERVAAGMAKLYVSQGRFAAACNAAQLVKALRYRMWPDTGQQCRQLPNVGKTTAARLQAAGLADLRILAAADPRRIEQAAQRFYPFGDQLQREVLAGLPPPLSFTLLSAKKTYDGNKIQVQLQLQRLDDNATSTSSAAAPQVNGSSYAQLMVGCVGNDKLLLHQSLVVETFQSPYIFNMAVDCPRPTAGPGNAGQAPGRRLVACVLLDKSLGLDTIQSFDLDAPIMSQPPSQQQQQHRRLTAHPAPQSDNADLEEVGALNAPSRPDTQRHVLQQAGIQEYLGKESAAEMQSQQQPQPPQAVRDYVPGKGFPRTRKATQVPDDGDKADAGHGVDTSGGFPGGDQAAGRDTQHAQHDDDHPDSHAPPAQEKTVKKGKTGTFSWLPPRPVAATASDDHDASKPVFGGILKPDGRTSKATDAASVRDTGFKTIAAAHDRLASLATQPVRSDVQDIQESGKPSTPAPCTDENANTNDADDDQPRFTLLKKLSLAAARRPLPNITNTLTIKNHADAGAADTVVDVARQRLVGPMLSTPGTTQMSSKWAALAKGRSKAPGDDGTAWRSRPDGSVGHLGHALGQAAITATRSQTDGATYAFPGMPDVKSTHHVMKQEYPSMDQAAARAGSSAQPAGSSWGSSSDGDNDGTCMDDVYSRVPEQATQAAQTYNTQIRTQQDVRRNADGEAGGAKVQHPAHLSPEATPRAAHAKPLLGKQWTQPVSFNTTLTRTEHQCETRTFSSRPNDPTQQPKDIRAGADFAFYQTLGGRQNSTVGTSTSIKPAQTVQTQPKAVSHAHRGQPGHMYSTTADHGTDKDLCIDSSAKQVLQHKLLGGSRQGMKRLQELVALSAKRQRTSHTGSAGHNNIANIQTRSEAASLFGRATTYVQASNHVPVPADTPGNAYKVQAVQQPAGFAPQQNHVNSAAHIKAGRPTTGIEPFTANVMGTGDITDYRSSAEKQDTRTKPTERFEFGAFLSEAAGGSSVSRKPSHVEMSHGDAQTKDAFDRSGNQDHGLTQVHVQSSRSRSLVHPVSAQLELAADISVFDLLMG